VKLRAGLTGGIGSGKSEVARRFAELGALVIDADELARLAVAPGSAGLRSVAARWPGALAPDGTVDRAALAAIVFKDGAAREALNQIVHPAVRALGLERERAAAPEQIVVHDVPLLFETGFELVCDATVLVVADRERRIERAVRRGGADRAEVERRMAAQIDPERAGTLADYVIENDGTLAELEARATDVFAALSGRSSGASRQTRSG
jgi:dephospho-CoA kinase